MQRLHWDECVCVQITQTGAQLRPYTRASARTHTEMYIGSSYVMGTAVRMKFSQPASVKSASDSFRGESVLRFYRPQG